MAASSDANAPGGEPLWEALTDILEAERREKQALREEVDALTRELQEARALQLATYERLKSAENDAARAAYRPSGDLFRRPPRADPRRLGATSRTGRHRQVHAPQRHGHPRYRHVDVVEAEAERPEAVRKGGPLVSAVRGARRRQVALPVWRERRE